MMRISASCLPLLALLALTGVSSAADPRLASHLDARTAASVDQAVEQARAAGLPTEPLITTALEGASRKASAERIVGAVRRESEALAAAREALGAKAAAPEIAAAAPIVLAGEPRDVLTRLRAARPTESLVVPFVVLADLLARGVSGKSASRVVVEAVRAGVKDGDLNRLREFIARDIQSGTRPGEAAEHRAHALMLELRSQPGGSSSPVHRTRPPEVDR